METWEKVSNIIIKRFNSDLICCKEYLIAKKHSIQKKAFSVFTEKQYQHQQY